MFEYQHPSFFPKDHSFFLHAVINAGENSMRFTDSVTFFLILKGQGQVYYQNKNISIKNGDFLFFPMHALISIQNSKNLQYYEIKLLPHFFESLCPDLADITFRHFHISENITDPRCVEIYRCLAGFIYAWLHGQKNLELIIRFSDLFLTLQKHFQNASNSAGLQDDYIYERISRTIGYVSLHYTEKITIPQISSIIGLNPQYFSSFFARNVGISFVDFVNHYRADKSLILLLDSELSITQIALESGFQTYKSYQNAFQKYYGCSPSAYRRQHAATEKNEMLPEESDISNQWNSSLFDFLQIYLTPDSLPAAQESSNKKQIHVDLDKASELTTEKRIHAVNIGSGYLLLQESLYEHLKKAAKECPFTHVHFRDVFGDLLSVYRETISGQPLFTWDGVDEILDRILCLRLFPYIELGYMPRELALTKDTLAVSYHPCIGIPKSYSLWEQMIRSFLSHCIRRYGIQNIRNWRFGFWNTANICSSDGYWSGTQEEFFHLYLSAYKVFQEFSLTDILGSPNFSMPDGLGWYDKFLEMCEKQNIKPGFLEIHMYSCTDDLTEFNGIFPNESSTYNFLSTTSDSIIFSNIMAVKELLKKHGFDSLPVIAGEWNITYHLLDLVRDTAFMATYVVHTWIQTLSMLDGITFSCLSDISEQTHPSSLLFPGAQGMISRNGLLKPAYHAFFMLNKLDREIIWNEYPCLITRGRHKWHILLYHISDYEKTAAASSSYVFEDYRYNVFKNTGDIYFQGNFKLTAGTWQISSYLIDKKHGCAYDEWARMGRPAIITDEIIQALNHASYPELHIDKELTSDSISIQVKLEPHTVVLYEINEIEEF